MRKFDLLGGVHMNVRGKVGDPMVVGWLFGGPVWLAPLVGLLILLLGYWFVVRVIEGRPLRFRKQYMGMWPGYLMLSAAYAAAYVGVREDVPAKSGQWWQSGTTHLWCLVFAIFATLVLAVPEVGRAYKYHFESGGDTPDDVMMVSEVWSPIKLYQYLACNFLFTFLLAVLLVPALFAAPGTFTITKLCVVVPLLAWASLALGWDNIAKRPDLNYVYSTTGWPILQRSMRDWFNNE